MYTWDGSVWRAGSTILGSPPPPAGNPILNGDYDLGTYGFNRWAWVQNKISNPSTCPGSQYIPGYPLQVVTDPIKGPVARYEVRAGDVFVDGTQRSQVSTLGDGSPQAPHEGDTRWYRVQHKFDSTFPLNHADLGWGVTAGWHPASPTGSGPFQLVTGESNGNWSLFIQKQSAPGTYLSTFAIWRTSLDRGNWHDVKLHIVFSTSDSVGTIELWHNGVRQTFLDSSTTYHVRTLVPGTTTVYYKEGIYHNPHSLTEIVYCTGFRAALTEADLG